MCRVLFICVREASDDLRGQVRLESGQGPEDMGVATDHLLVRINQPLAAVSPCPIQQPPVLVLVCAIYERCPQSP